MLLSAGLMSIGGVNVTWLELEAGDMPSRLSLDVCDACLTCRLRWGLSPADGMCVPEEVGWPWRERWDAVLLWEVPMCPYTALEDQSDTRHGSINFLSFFRKDSTRNKATVSQHRLLLASHQSYCIMVHAMKG
jgi:hypothetical protein